MYNGFFFEKIKIKDFVVTIQNWVLNKPVVHINIVSIRLKMQHKIIFEVIRTQNFSLNKENEIFKK